MKKSSPEFVALDMLTQARRVADFAESVGFCCNVAPRRARPIQHLGAVLADAVLQAGVNYRTVVKPRIDRILKYFPESSTLAGTIKIVESNSVGEFLMWKHSEKVDRFIRLHCLLEAHRVEDAAMLRAWLKRSSCRDELLSIHGVGPKTVDYMSCLVGIDSVAVDRHIRGFAKQAGVEVRDYEQLRSIFCCAADLLDTPRRDFDAWVWTTRANGIRSSAQYELF